MLLRWRGGAGESCESSDGVHREMMTSLGKTRAARKRWQMALVVCSESSRRKVESEQEKGDAQESLIESYAVLKRGARRVD